MEPEEIHTPHTIKVKVCRKPSQSPLKTNKINISTFPDIQPEEFLALMINFKTTINVTVMNTASGRIYYLRTMLCGTSLRGFYKLSLAGNLTANNLKHIMEGLLEYLPPPNSLSKQKHVMIRAMHKPCNMLFKSFEAQLTDINNVFLSYLDRKPPRRCLLDNSMRSFYMMCLMVGTNKPTYKDGTLG